MNKLLLNVYCPEHEQSFDVKIPQHLTVSETTNMLVGFLKNEPNGVSKADYILCNLETGAVYKKTEFMGDLGLHTGARLMLV